jgi:aminopeptidase N
LIVRARVNGETVERRLILDGESAEVDLGARPEWIVANSGAHGFYRVSYSPDLLAPIVAEAEELLSPSERYALIDDTWASVLAGELAAFDFVDLVSGFAYEPDVAVWRIIIDGLRMIDRIVDGHARDALKKRVALLTTSALDIVGYEPADGEDPLTRELRGVLLGAAAKLGGDGGALSLARELTELVGDDAAAVEPNLAAAAVSIVAAHGGAAERDEFVRRYRDATTPQGEIRYLMALTELPGPEEFASMLEMTLGEVRSQTAPLMLSLSLANRDRGTDAWYFMQDNWDELTGRFPSNLQVRMMTGLRAVTAPHIADDAEAFLAEHELPQGRLLLQQYLEKLRVNVALGEREADRLPAALLR